MLGGRKGPASASRAKEVIRPSEGELFISSTLERKGRREEEFAIFGKSASPPRELRVASGPPRGTQYLQTRSGEIRDI